MGKDKARIEKDFIILCEGIDEMNFLVYYLNSDALKFNYHYSEDIQIFDFGGIKDLKKFLKSFKNYENFDEVKRILIIRDAESDYRGAINSVKSSLKDVGLSTPQNPGEWTDEYPAIGFLLFPTCDRESRVGTLEDLCLDLINEDGKEIIGSEIANMFNQLKNKKRKSFPREFKNKLHTYFSVTNEYVGSKIGEAAKKGAFDWESPKLDYLKKFIGIGFCKADKKI